MVTNPTTWTKLEPKGQLVGTTIAASEAARADARTTITNIAVASVTYLAWTRFDSKHTVSAMRKRSHRCAGGRSQEQSGRNVGEGRCAARTPDWGTTGLFRAHTPDIGSAYRRWWSKYSQTSSVQLMAKN